MELHLAKMRMDQDFQKNRVLPGDPRYEYDKQVREVRVQLRGVPYNCTISGSPWSVEWSSLLTAQLMCWQS
jgi:hypothetical protein